MSKLKHSKIRNTGLLFEILVRQVTADILDNKKNTALNIIKKFFNENTQLGKELSLYNALLNEKFNSDDKANFFIAEIINVRSKLNTYKLKREKFNLIKEIKQNFDEQKIMSSKVLNYKTYASIYKLFEFNDKMSPQEKTNTHFLIIEHLTTKASPSLKSIIKNTSESDKEIRTLAVKIMMEKFNSKYSNLNQQQRRLLKEYINNVSNTNDLKQFLKTTIPILKKDLKGQFSKIKDKVIRIKLKEAVNSMDKLCKIDKVKFVKDSVVVQTLRYMELLKELKKYGQSSTIN